MEDRCPGVLRLHAAADGHLLRIRLPGGQLGPAALSAIADLAAFGNGLIELTSRASVQVRGLDPGDAGRAAERLRAGGLLPSPIHDRVRNLLASPLGGRDSGALLRTDALVAAIDRGLCRDLALAGLPGRFLFAIEDGSQILGGRQGDVSLVAEPDADAEVRLRLRLAGRPTARTAAPGEAAELALDAARAFIAVLAGLPESREDAYWRIADLPDSGFTRLLARLETTLVPGSALDSGRGVSVGRLAQADGGNAITALAPLGRLDAAAVRGLAALAGTGVGGVRVSPWRTISVVEVPDAGVARVAEALSRLGLVLDPQSGWAGLSACAGLGACGNARIDVRAAAAERARVRGAAGTGASEHWSACERRCGRPAVVARAVTSTPDGLEVDGDGTTWTVSSVDDALALLGGVDVRARAVTDGGSGDDALAAAVDGPGAAPADRAVVLAAGGRA
jgi:sulfite reductase beta subunit-like hemoprotein